MYQSMVSSGYSADVAAHFVGWSVVEPSSPRHAPPEEYALVTLPAGEDEGGGGVSGAERNDVSMGCASVGEGPPPESCLHPDDPNWRRPDYGTGPSELRFTNHMDPEPQKVHGGRLLSSNGRSIVPRVHTSGAPLCVDSECPCTSTWNNLPGEHCCHTCRTTRRCTGNWHATPFFRP